MKQDSLTKQMINEIKYETKKDLKYQTHPPIGGKSCTMQCPKYKYGRKFEHFVGDWVKAIFSKYSQWIDNDDKKVVVHYITKWIVKMRHTCWFI